MLRSVKTLEDNIVQIEKHYDDLNVAFAQCDTSDHSAEFPGSKFIFAAFSLSRLGGSRLMWTGFGFLSARESQPISP